MIYLLLSFLIGSSIAFTEEVTKISCALHIHSSISGGKNSVEQIVAKAKEFGIESIVLTDHLIREVEFGLWPLRKVLKLTKTYPSVFRFGIKNYLKTIEKISRCYPDIILVSGVEVTPYYYWSVEENNLIANNLHTHLLLIGLEKEQNYKRLPVLGNELGSGLFNIKLILLIALLVILSIVLRSWKLLAISTVLVLYNYPFKSLPFNQYVNRENIAYQYLFDYITKTQNYIISIWSHPEATNYEKKTPLTRIGKLTVCTRTIPYEDMLVTTKGYDGFSIFAEGYRKVGNPLGIWDFILKEYIDGKREKPVWCYSEVDLVEVDDEIYFRKNILYVSSKTYENVVRSLKRGNLYAVWRNKDRELVLNNFRLNDDTAVFGETYDIVSDKLKIEFELNFSDNKQEKVKIWIIRNNEIVYNQEKLIPTKVTYYDKTFAKKHSYYRVFIQGEYPHMLATNPVFIK
ncbi:MAG: PHP domain-containing protein [Elusimicrobiota bacterium]|nr:PHP domain-containing protein [Elusimicrobiota bacterium]